MHDPYTDLEINCRAQLSILETVRHENPEAKVVFATTRQLYGRPQYLPVDERHPLAPGRPRTASTRPRASGTTSSTARSTALRCSRAAADEHVRAADAGQGRAADVPGHVAAAGGARRGAARSSATGSSGATSPSSTMRSTPFCSRRVVDAADGEVFNVGGEPRCQPARAGGAAGRGRRGGAWQLVPFPEERRSIDIGDYYADDSKIRAALGWEPRVGAARGARAVARVLPRARSVVLVECVPFLDLARGAAAMRDELEDAFAARLAAAGS